MNYSMDFPGKIDEAVRPHFLCGFGYSEVGLKTIIALVAFVPFASFANTMFTISKTYKPKNVLHYEAVVKNCSFASPYANPVWIMGEQKGQREALSSQEKKYLQPKIKYAKDSEFDFTFDAVKELKTSGKDFKEVKVRLVNCKAVAYTEYKGQEIQLKNIHLKFNLASITGATVTGLKPDGSKFSVELKK